VNPDFNPYFFSIKADSSQVAEIDLDRNLFFTARTDAAMVDIVGTTGSYSMDEWVTYQSETGWDTYSPSPQPLGLVDGPGGDFHLADGSPAIGAGEPVVGVTSDHDGYPRSDPPSLGAYAARPQGLLFSDDFESGGVLRWSTTAP
jgi:hypothetical protein